MEQHNEEIIKGEMVVLLEDECHLLWGDVCGYVWGRRGEAIEVPMTNYRQRQTYYGAVNFVSREFHLQAFSAGDSGNTISYIKWLMQIYEGKRLLLLWDGATYHRDQKMKEFLAEVNQGLAEEEFVVSLMAFAPNAPEQNPVEDVWLAGKNHLRRSFAVNKTFAQVKESFCSFLKSFCLESVKFDWYAPAIHLI